MRWKSSWYMIPSQYWDNDKIHWNGWEGNTLCSDGRKCKSSYPDQQVQCQIRDVDQLIKTWAADATYFKQQPGFISVQLHRGIGGSCVFVNYAVWESSQLFKNAANKPEFKSKLGEYPDSATASPFYLRKLRYPEFVLLRSIRTSCGGHPRLP
jgi:heme-degrading monooxygenase HmoA